MNGPFDRTLLFERGKKHIIMFAVIFSLSVKGYPHIQPGLFHEGDSVTITYNVCSLQSNLVQVMGGFPGILTNGFNTASSNILSEERR
jgi:hypothetical protein